MTQYAKETTVSLEKSLNEIQGIVRRYKAESYAYGWEGNRIVIMFKIANRHIRFILELPDQSLKKYEETPTGRWREEKARIAAWEQDCRQRGRALALVIKAKFEAVETGITTIEQEFLAHIVLPDNSTVGQFIGQQLERVYSTGQMPSPIAGLLPGPKQR